MYTCTYVRSCFVDFGSCQEGYYDYLCPKDGQHPCEAQFLGGKKKPKKRVLTVPRVLGENPHENPNIVKTPLVHCEFFSDVIFLVGFKWGVTPG